MCLVTVLCSSGYSDRALFFCTTDHPHSCMNRSRIALDPVDLPPVGLSVRKTLQYVDSAIQGAADYTFRAPIGNVSAEEMQYIRARHARLTRPVPMTTNQARVENQLESDPTEVALADKMVKDHERRLGTRALMVKKTILDASNSHASTTFVSEESDHDQSNDLISSESDPFFSAFRSSSVGCSTYSTSSSSSSPSNHYRHPLCPTVHQPPIRPPDPAVALRDGFGYLYDILNGIIRSQGKERGTNDQHRHIDTQSFNMGNNERLDDRRRMCSTLMQPNPSAANSVAKAPMIFSSSSSSGVGTMPLAQAAGYAHGRTPHSHDYTYGCPPFIPPLSNSPCSSQSHTPRYGPFSNPSTTRSHSSSSPSSSSSVRVDQAHDNVDDAHVNVADDNVDDADVDVADDNVDAADVDVADDNVNVAYDGDPDDWGNEAFKPPPFSQIDLGRSQTWWNLPWEEGGRRQWHLVYYRFKQKPKRDEERKAKAEQWKQEASTKAYNKRGPKPKERRDGKEGHRKHPMATRRGARRISSNFKQLHKPKGLAKGNVHLLHPRSLSPPSSSSCPSSSRLHDNDLDVDISSKYDRPRQKGGYFTTRLLSSSSSSSSYSMKSSPFDAGYDALLRDAVSLTRHH